MKTKYDVFHLLQMLQHVWYMEKDQYPIKILETSYYACFAGLNFSCINVFLKTQKVCLCYSAKFNVIQ